MCIISRMMVDLRFRAKANPNPIVISKIAKRGSETFGWRRPNVIAERVRPAISSAGLTPGRSLRAPNQMKMMAIAYRRILTACFAIKSQSAVSIEATRLAGFGAEMIFMLRLWGAMNDQVAEDVL